MCCHSWGFLFLFFLVACPFIKLEHNQKHDSFCFYGCDGYYTEFWSGFLGPEIVSHEFFCWMRYHSLLLLDPSPNSANHYYSSFTIQLEFEVAGNRD